MTFLLTLILFFQSATAADQTLDPKAIADEKKVELDEKNDFSILRYKPIYFAYGNPSTKIQFSFRSPIIRDQNLFFAYSQIIFWNLLETSKPFLDATYNPELFYRFDMNESKTTSIDLGLFEHNSNGKASPDTRSYNQTYLRANYKVLSGNWVLTFTGKVRYIYGDDPENRNITDFAGPLALDIRVAHLYSGWIDKSELTFSLIPGGKWSQRIGHGGYQVGYSFRLGALHLVPAFYLQYYEGYAETLLNYDQRVSEFRAGLVF